MLTPPLSAWKITELETAAVVSRGHISNVRRQFQLRRWVQVDNGEPISVFVDLLSVCFLMNQMLSVVCPGTRSRSMHSSKWLRCCAASTFRRANSETASWLSQALKADLLQTTPQNITIHLNPTVVLQYGTVLSLYHVTIRLIVLSVLETVFVHSTTGPSVCIMLLQTTCYSFSIFILS